MLRSLLRGALFDFTTRIATSLFSLLLPGLVVVASFHLSTSAFEMISSYFNAAMSLMVSYL